MKRTAERLFGSQYLFSILAAGRHQMRLGTIGAIMGGNVRVGLEDSIYLGKGELARSNADQVKKIRGILKALSLEPATPTRPAPGSASRATTAWGFRGGPHALVA
jgi:uncharacterized protein (DUF849 family)